MLSSAIDGLYKLSLSVLWNSFSDFLFLTCTDLVEIRSILRNSGQDQKLYFECVVLCKLRVQTLRSSVVDHGPVEETRM